MGTETKEARKARIDSIINAEIRLQEDGKTIHLERSDPEGKDDKGKWKSREHIKAETEAIRY